LAEAIETVVGVGGEVVIRIGDRRAKTFSLLKQHVVEPRIYVSVIVIQKSPPWFESEKLDSAGADLEQVEDMQWLEEIISVRVISAPNEPPS